ncbi:hypothetical protein [Candidatus Clostridium radicumherbarum]|uniref:Holin n=1 Tax=Candidatus Clostridium radicumherbarum TaxID=3381662 RepID=A0ABW8TSP2_9CLOT
MSEFSSFSPKDLSILASVVAIAIAENRTPADINIIGNLFTAIGSLLLTMAAQEESLKSSGVNQNQTK